MSRGFEEQEGDDRFKISDCGFKIPPYRWRISADLRYESREDTDFQAKRAEMASENILEDFDKYFVFHLTVTPTLYKYMRIYLLAAVRQRC